uniref:G-protein coupled receptors family 1 profile domain-containing protein n=1 Tax=Plectus sambesii TaxID=2011161 RepID=A0A914WX80_9BILA
MVNDTTFDYLNEFYGNSAKPYAICVLIILLLAFIGNIFFITLTLTTKCLRKNVANWFLLGFSLSDLVQCTAHLFNAYALYNGSVDSRQLCTVAGLLVVSTGTCNFGFPALIAADRYYKISTVPQSKGLSIGRAIFTEGATIPLMVGWFFLSVLLNLPLMLNDAWGEDPAGFCGTKKFTSVPLLISYECTVILVFVGSMIITAIYYYRLVAWLKQQEASRRRRRSNICNNDVVDYTSGVMRVVKIFTLIPICTMTPTAILTAGQMILPVMPMWINRLLIAPYFFSSVTNPWLTIALIGQFRVRFLELASNAKAVYPKTIDRLKSRSNTVRRI